MKNSREKSSRGLFRLPGAQGLYDPAFEQDSCGVGFVAQERGYPDHEILETALAALDKLSHRGAVDADEHTGDGAGILAQIPQRLFERELAKFEIPKLHPQDLGVGTVFLPLADAEARERGRRIIEDCLGVYGLKFFGWRWVPYESKVLGAKAMHLCPDIKQILVGRPDHVSPANFDRALFLARKEMERRLAHAGIDTIYFPSFSSRTIVYKGLLMAGQLRQFYADLQDPLFETALVVFHQRYSTNTFPTWPLAQPFRCVAHNGEINTIQGNRNWMRARVMANHQPTWSEKSHSLEPIIQPGGSDSASFDNAVEAIHFGGRDINHTLMMLIPEPWQNSETMKPAAREFYEYHGCLAEAWDGPAAVVFSDGRYVGGVMDRNGLRPMRYKRCRSGLVVLASELGVVDIPDREVIEKGRVGPGRMLVVDTKEGKFLNNTEIKKTYFQAEPYGQWVSKHMVFLGGRDSWPLSGPERRTGAQGFTPRHPELRPLKEGSVLELRRLQVNFGFTKEELDLVLNPMASTAKEPVGSMGDDTPIAAFSERPVHLSKFFKQRFAQVTNPPIDSIREARMMTLNTYLGKRGNIFSGEPEHAHLLRLPTALIWDSDLAQLEHHQDSAFRSERLSTVFAVRDGTEGLERVLHQICHLATKAIEKGARILILSDRDVDHRHASIPMLLAVSAVHHHLIRSGKRLCVSIVADTGDAWDVHHFATLIGFGASVINPYLALHTIRQMCEDGKIKDIDWQVGCGRYHFAIDQGMLKIMAKMGISTLASYRGAQVFDALAINQAVIDCYFTGTASKLGGVGLVKIAADVLTRHRQAFGLQDAKDVASLPVGGNYNYKRGEETHAFSPQLVKFLQKAVADNDIDSYRKFSELLQEQPPIVIRDLLRLREDRFAPPSLDFKEDEVQSVEDIRKRFGTGGMSLGALSEEAHECLAIAMNRIGGRSNSGEGGEDPRRFKPEANGDWRNSATKQVASGRFGVTPQYLGSAKEIQIKMAQGSKPGEGGQLPGYKVSEVIARLRHSSPGVTLISPPPHHDIYSIEDLAQLIFDLRQINPRADISVKLVSLHGVGTIAAGVAKADADVVHIGGYDGGTGASPLSSIKNAGLPWELGLAEAHQTLVLNNLRSRVRLRVDGGLKTGLDIIKAAILGADEFDFGSIALVAEGCVMVRKCHLNTCPTGVATQDPELRKKFKGTPERVVNYFTFVAQEVREYLIKLGVKDLKELMGKTDLLEQISARDKKYSGLDLSLLLHRSQPAFHTSTSTSSTSTGSAASELQREILRKAKPALTSNKPVSMDFVIGNEHRTIGAYLAGEIVRSLEGKTLPPEIITVNLTGTAGQSFGAFCVDGMRLNLVGEANDYVGKGMAGGIVTIRPPADCGFDPTTSAIIGNTVLYGATGGSLFVSGRAGERFAVRNSGATAVVEGVGHHACEYMTNGKVVILGKVSGNLGAGMSGGVAYVLDEKEKLPLSYNPGMVELVRLSDAKEIGELKALIKRHEEVTESKKAKEVLELLAAKRQKILEGNAEAERDPSDTTN